MRNKENYYSDSSFSVPERIVSVMDAGIQFVSTREIAKTIKNILRQKFPNTKFSVRSSREHNAIIVD